MARRLALTVAMLAVALVATGTAQAQSALPGDPLYTWKRTSEQAMLSLSPDPLGTELFLADRRLDELIQVEKDPRRSLSALNGYYEALNAISATADGQARERIVPLLQAHQRRIANSGIASPQLEQLLTAAVTTMPLGEDTGSIIGASTLTSGSTSTEMVLPTEIASTSTSGSTDELAPTLAPLPTDVPPTATAYPTDIPPTATATPTDEPPTPTAIVPSPTDILPTPTDDFTGEDATAMPTPASPTDTAP